MDMISLFPVSIIIFFFFLKKAMYIYSGVVVAVVIAPRDQLTIDAVC
jgi:hypothetical protein